MIRRSVSSDEALPLGSSSPSVSYGEYFMFCYMHAVLKLVYWNDTSDYTANIGIDVSFQMVGRARFYLIEVFFVENR